jgi:hypothetical protein
MMMCCHIGVEIRLGSVDRDLPQQSNLGELVQRVVNRGQGHRHFRAGGFFVKHLSGEMAIALAEQDPAQGHALTGRAQPDLPQHSFDVVPRAAGQRRPVRRALGASFDIRYYHGARRSHFFSCLNSQPYWGASQIRFICNIYEIGLLDATASQLKAAGFAASGRR